jgi:nitroreductase
MDLFEAIEKRHSYRGDFTDAPVPEDDLRKIVLAGIHAPSGCNAQSTSFVIINDPKLINEISALLNKDYIATGKAIIACIVNHQPVYHGMAFGPEDCAAAVENMLLAISALGYATVWLDGCLRVEERAKRIAEIINVPEDMEVRVLLPVGVPVEEWAPKEKKSFDERASFNSYSL